MTTHEPERQPDPAAIAPAEHDLKCWPEFFDAITRGDKTFEIRKNDRGFQRGDILVLRKYDPNARWASRPYVSAQGFDCEAKDAATCRVAVSYVLSGFGLEPGYVCMAIAKVQASTP